MATSSPTTMRAWTYTHPLPSGSLSSGLKLNTSAPSPTTTRPLKASELLIKVLAMSLNPADHRVPELPLVGRFAATTPASPGMDFCGRVIGLGSGQHSEHDPVSAGDMVFGKLPGPTQFGTMAEVTVVESKYVSKVQKGSAPEWKSLSSQERDETVVQFAALPTAGLTAWQAAGSSLSEHEPTVFVNGGASGTGHLAIRLIRHSQPTAHIVTTASPRNMDFVKALGVDAVIDYTRTPSLSDALHAHTRAINKPFDRIIDCIGGDLALYSRSSEFLKSSKEGGAFVQVGAKTSFAQAGAIIKNVVLGTWSWVTGGQRAAYKVMVVETTREDLRALEVASQGVKVEVQRVYEMEEGKEALEMVESGKTTGKVVVVVARE